VRAFVSSQPNASPAKIAAAVRSVLDDERYREAAQRLAVAIAEETAGDSAVAELEDLARAQGEAVPVTA
jgi:UDP:flavonoid glycosyltransferase YjiC (YdhE family)